MSRSEINGLVVTLVHFGHPLAFGPPIDSLVAPRPARWRDECGGAECNVMWLLPTISLDASRHPGSVPFNTSLDRLRRYLFIGTDAAIERVTCRMGSVHVCMPDLGSVI